MHHKIHLTDWHVFFQGLAPAEELLKEGGVQLQRFVVQLEEGGAEIDSMEGLLDALGE